MEKNEREENIKNNIKFIRDLDTVNFDKNGYPIFEYIQDYIDFITYKNTGFLYN
tara:strand:- start:880 stop:1041 length:162 start_codon:yes stop_codon:yes gene_type:complete